MGFCYTPAAARETEAAAEQGVAPEQAAVDLTALRYVRALYDGWLRWCMVWGLPGYMPGESPYA